MKTIPAIAFKAKNKRNRYLCDGPDCGDWSDENLDVTNIEDALCLVRKDKERLTDDDVDSFFHKLQFLDWVDAMGIKEHYDPDHIDLTEAQFNVIKKRNDWGTDD
ncbi:MULTISPECIES: hypothetical protein [Bacillus]|uniref:hypothetical protein n=1 Tax=Bacillus TaxID=1386 RepID=UPI0003620C78|nr:MULTISPECIES: hypothetical protein [Bacillus]APJ26605.1 hypothetical protein BSZ43_07325 [Bacillus sp. H15-1]ASV14980.1 hypothetical protein CJO35_07380 [Bacillus sp. 1s-1]KAA0815486.1 hypothetical protein EI974_16565 [Bacillus licheniformis]KAA0830955.1 hypothetical protein EI980_12370 [Bacillus licheniformis]KAA0847509.1 hypothetical protein EI975_07345 [Bacillus licheniformis]